MTSELRPDQIRNLHLGILISEAENILLELDGVWPHGSARRFSSLPPRTEGDLRRALEEIYNYGEGENPSE
jgi:hypothetical protein